MEQQKMKITQNALYNYLKEHDVIFSRLAELMNITPSALMANFRHHKNRLGKPRTFSVEKINELNAALPKFARELRDCVMTFGTDKMYTNKHGRTYDPGMIEPINKLGKLLNTTAIAERLLGWNRMKKAMIFGAHTSKFYGHISEDDVTMINSEILSIVGVLNNIEVVPDENANDGSSSSIAE